jgi:hypothetical protein
MKGGFDVSSNFFIKMAFNSAPKDGTHNDQVRYPLEKFKPKYDSSSKIDLMNARMLQNGYCSTWAGSATKCLIIIIIIIII